MGRHSDCFVGASGSQRKRVSNLECGNACFNVEHELFCTNQPSVIGLDVLIAFRLAADSLEHCLLCTTKGPFIVWRGSLHPPLAGTSFFVYNFMLGT